MIHDCSSFGFGAIQKQNSSGFKNSPYSCHCLRVKTSQQHLIDLEVSFTASSVGVGVGLGTKEG